MVDKDERADNAQAAAEDAGLDETAAEGSPPNEDMEAPDGASAAVELLEAQRQRDEYKDALVRERADFENYKKRNAALASSSVENGIERAVNAVLPVLDNFERALAAECADKQFANGMEMTMRQLQAALQELGVAEIDTQGEFDPTRHHAVGQTEIADLGSNMVAETLQKGYTLNGRVIRPAMVQVNK